jgi:arylsulfatase A-like enzyme
MNKPNILLITIDSLRADHLSAYGYRKETTPHLDLFSEEAATFENAFAAGNWTGASIASILTGLYPTCHGLNNQRYYLDPNVPSLAKLLKDHGYFTICFSNNIYITPETGLSQGFTDFRYRGQSRASESQLKGRAGNNRLAGAVKDRLSLRTRTMLKDVYDTFSPQRALTRDDGAFSTEHSFLKWIDKHDREKPFFAYIHYQEPHSIYFPPIAYRKRFFDGSWFEQGSYLDFDHIGYFAGKVRFAEQEMDHYQQLYDGEIAYLDWRLGRLFEFFRRKNLIDDTVVIITADHGECMGENGFLWHAFCLYDPLIRVPLIIRYPDWFAKGSQSKQLVQTNDLVPTLLAGLGIDWDYKNENQGISLLNGPERKAVLTEADNPEKMVARWLNRRKDLSEQDFSGYYRDLRSYRTQTEKLIWASDGWHEFYDLRADPGEEHNIYSSSGERVKMHEKSMQEWIGSFQPHVADTTRPGFDKDTWEKMKALGYA